MKHGERGMFRSHKSQASCQLPELPANAEKLIKKIACALHSLPLPSLRTFLQAKLEEI